MRVDPFLEHHDKVAEAVAKEYPDPETTFNKATLDQFFHHPVWAEIDKMLAIRQAGIISEMLDPTIPRDTDLTRKGQFTETIFIRRIRGILEE